VTKYATSGFVYRLQAGQSGGQHLITSIILFLWTIFMRMLILLLLLMLNIKFVICGGGEIATATGINKDKYSIIPS
jgi:hypothetical protein